jgi:hypothetical protein
MSLLPYGTRTARVYPLRTNRKDLLGILLYGMAKATVRKEG